MANVAVGEKSPTSYVPPVWLAGAWDSKRQMGGCRSAAYIQEEIEKITRSVLIITLQKSCYIEIFSMKAGGLKSSEKKCALVAMT